MGRPSWPVSVRAREEVLFVVGSSSIAIRGKNAAAISPVALAAVKRIDALFDIERDINGLSAEERLRVRQEQSAPLLAALEAWLREEHSRLSRSASVAQPIDYMLKRWDRFARFIEDGRVCLTNNAAERAQKRAVRWPRSRGGELGGHRLTCRDLQTVWCRSASLLRRRAHKARQSLACIAPRRAHALGLGSTAFRRSPRGVITRATRVRAQSNEKIKPSEQCDRRIAYRELAVRFTDAERYFVSEASVYRLLKAHDLITSPAFIVMKAADEFKDKTTAPNQLWQTDFTYLKVTGWGGSIC